MSAKEKRGSEDLPNIPDYPDAPLAPWRHYGITDYAGKRVQEELDRLGYQGYLIGLRVGYSVDDGTDNPPSYVMSFGRVPPLEIPLIPETEDPLSDDFLLDLYDTVNALVHQYTPEVFNDLDVEVSANVSGSEHSSTIKCLNGGYQCDQGHSGRRKCVQRQSGAWICKHATCT